MGSFTEEALILPGPVMKRWTAGRILYGVGTGVSMAATGLAGIGGIILAAGGSTESPSDPGPALSLAGSIGNISGTAFLVGGLALQHSALGMIGRDSGRIKFVTGLVFGALGLASVLSGFIVGGMDIPNKDIINYAVGYGGTALLTTSSGILINDAKNLRKTWDMLGMRPGAPPPFPMPDGRGMPPMPPMQPMPPPGAGPYPAPQQPYPYPQQPYPYPQQQPSFPPPG